MKEILHVRVGTDERPSSQPEIDEVKKEVEKTLKKASKKDTIVFATHHAVALHNYPQLFNEINSPCNIMNLFDKGLIDKAEARKLLGLDK